MLIDLRLILILMVTIIGGLSIPSSTPINGLIEGFYWSSSNAVHGQYNFYTKKQRDELIASMDGIMNYYFYSPQDREDDPFTMTLWNAQEIADWTDTISKASNVSIVVGLRPRWIDTIETTLQLIKLKLNQLISIGIRYYILCWDDASGAGTSAQMTLQRDLIGTLIDEVKDIELIGIIPAYYARSQTYNDTDQAWIEQLSILNEISNNIRFFVTGLTVVPSSIQISDIPSLINRQFIFFDNWIAVDSNSRVTMTWPPNRQPSIYHANQSISGSVLNLAYPPERIIHEIYALKQRINNTYSNINAHQAAEFWAKYLIKNDFYQSNVFEELKDNLQSLIEHGYETNSEINKNYPFLQRIFTN